MPRSLADAKKALFILATKPADPSKLTVAEATAATPAVRNASCNILSGDYDLGATGSDRVQEKSLCATGNAETLGASNYGGGFTVFRHFDPTTKQADATADWLWELVKEKGATLHLIERHNAKASTEPLAVGDEYSYFEYLTDDPKPTTLEGYIKHRIDGAVQNAELYKKIVSP